MLSLVLDKERSVSDVGGKAFAWALQEVPLTADARNAEYCSHLWKKSMAWAGLEESDEKVPLSEQRHQV